MRVEVIEETTKALEAYASIPIAFDVSLVLDVAETAAGPSQFVLTERRLDIPYLKNYDALNGACPTQWAMSFDLSNWGLFGAWIEGRRVGGATVAFNTAGVLLLEGRTNLAVLWDIRVSPEARCQGVGSALFQAAEAWAKARGCRQLRVETQNINIPACRFYARRGCSLSKVDRDAYPDLSDEIQLIWCKDL
ncbi:MAG: GNAT family N-acetyltransferase [Acidobacteriota bacterium]|nr:GNAT family N-acetyltransferase [Acidobacteriota bacterium]